MSGDWLDHAACRGADLSLFFPSRGQVAASTAKAREICGACTVATECLEDALSRSGQVGFQAGMTVGQRNAVKRRREGAGR